MEDMNKRLKNYNPNSEKYKAQKQVYFLMQYHLTRKGK